MKKLISVLLIFSMILLGSVPVFAAETAEDTESFDISKLFVNYEEKTIAEMVKYIYENQAVYAFVEYFRNHGSDPDQGFGFPEITIYMSGNYKTNEVWNAFYSNLTDEHSKYIVLNGSRPSNSDAPGITDAMLGEIGTKCFCIDFTNEFFDHIKSLNRLDGNVLIMDFLMNLLDGDVTGISFDENEVCWDADYGHAFESDRSDSGTIMNLGDCNGDDTVNSMDAYLMKLALIGSDVSLDPFAVDVNCDGNLNAMDSFALKKTVVSG